MLNLQELQLLASFLDRTLAAGAVRNFEDVSLCYASGQLARRELVATLAAEERAK